jgi:alginate O-acetyltransferase complex protein AlgI
MPFNTYTFVIFFFSILIIYYLLPDWRQQKIALLTSSYLFYSAWNPVFVLLLFLSTICDWFVAIRMAQAISKNTKFLYLTASLLINLGLLGYFKYGGFVLDTFVQFLRLFGVVYQPLHPDIALPVGISFYTFQTLSYTIDVYRGKIKPENSLLDFALFVSFFPQLVAGPIVRADYFLPQCHKPRRANLDQFGWGLALLVIGLFMKVILADTVLSPVSDQVYNNPALAGRVETWAAVLAFSGQIYYDFSGYSTCAIGAALCFGFILPDNFRYPYASVGFREFWQRWHISLSSWLRDYLYISMGGNRISALRTNINIMGTMLIGGLWHGASWLFVIWGGLHGLYLVMEKALRERVPDEIQLNGITRALIMILTFLIISVTWVFFRARSLHDAVLIISNLFTYQQRQLSFDAMEIRLVFATIILLVCWHIYSRNKSIEHFFSFIPIILRAAILFGLIMTMYLFSVGDDRAFIYYQF